MDPCCVPYCFLVSLAGLILLAGVSLALKGEYQYLHVHGNQSAQTTLQAAMLCLLPALLCAVVLCRTGPKEERPTYLEGPRQANSSFDSATNLTPLLASS